MLSLGSYWIALMFLAVATAVSGQVHPPSDPAKGFDPSAASSRPIKAVKTAPDPSRINSANPIVLLPQHGNAGGGVDHGYSNVGVVFGARIYSANLVNAIELFYYIPSNSDSLYRVGDYRASTGRIGGNSGTDNGEYYCPGGYAAVGLQGASGLAIDRIGLVCGQIGDLSKMVSLPIFGGGGGKAFYDNCASVRSLGFLTGVRVRSGAWMDSIQGLCQAATADDSETPAVREKPVFKVADDRAAEIVIGTRRSEVLQKLGEPSSKMSGGVERLTYELESGGALRIELEDGRVTRIQGAGGR
jgi:hypothetical protein